MRFQILKSASMKMTVFWDVAPYSLVAINRSFRSAYFLHYQSATRCDVAEDSHSHSLIHSLSLRHTVTPWICWEKASSHQAERTSFCLKKRNLSNPFIGLRTFRTEQMNRLQILNITLQISEEFLAGFCVIIWVRVLYHLSAPTSFHFRNSDVISVQSQSLRQTISLFLSRSLSLSFSLDARNPR
jgi:hypothetical protein